MGVTARVRAALREPLAWTLLLGGAFFAVDRALRPPDPRRIVVDAAVLRGVEADHQRRVGRAPSARERDELVERWIDEEVRVREAERLGLARGDVIVRRRLVQKMDQILDQTTRLEPHAPPRSVAVERITVDHVFLSSARPSAEADARAALAEVVVGRDPGALGDPFPHGARLRERTRTELASLLGARAADELWLAPDAAWRGPIVGAAGLHVARVVERVTREELESGAPDPDAARRAALARLRASYAIEVRR